MKTFAILVCGILLVCVEVILKKDPTPIENEPIVEILSRIPQKDRIHLEYFFSQCIGWDELGYVLFGDKPMALSSYEHIENPLSHLRALKYALSPRRIKHLKGYQAWKKYEKLFSITQFIFIYEENRDGTDIILVNKEKFIQTVDAHQSDFESILKRPITGKGLLEEISREGLSKSPLFNHDLLLGILFGYGRGNALLFEQRTLLPLEKVEDFDRKHHFAAAWKEEEIAEWEEAFTSSVNWISAYITGSHLKNMELNPLPGFMAVLDSPETEAIKQQYLETRKKLIDAYKGKDFLETTLQQLIAD